MARCGRCWSRSHGSGWRRWPGARTDLLRRFAVYLDRRFAVRQLVAGLRDGRRRPQIATATVWLAVFAMFVVRGRSFNALEQELRRPGRWEGWLGSRRKPSADTLGRMLATLELPRQRQLVATINRQAWRRKTIHGRPGEAYRVVGVDGHELWASRARCCGECLTREVMVRGEKVLEYYHLVVVLKQEARELYQDADRLRALQPPVVREEAARTTRLWDLPDLTSFPTAA